MSTFGELSKYAGIALPEGVDARETAPETRGEWLSCDVLANATKDLPADKAGALFAALDAIERDDNLLRLSCALRDKAPVNLMTARSGEYATPKPTCLTGFARDAYAFLYALSCVQAGREELRRRGVSEQYDLDIPERMIRARMKRYAQTGDINFTDYPWDMNFYCCAIVYLTRFYFIPCRCDYPNVFVHRQSGDTLALWGEETRVRRDGQLNGVNGVFDDCAFDVTFEETDESYIGYPVHPEGRIENKKTTLKKSQWDWVLRSGDLTLALHIPGGAGYTPENVRASVLEARDYYNAYFPDVPYKGVWSESWLYDYGLRALLPETSNIVRVQKQFYNYPTMEGEEQAKLEVFGDENIDVSTIAPKTSLERGLLKAWRDGKRFHTTGMFVLTKDFARIGSQPYPSSDTAREGGDAR